MGNFQQTADDKVASTQRPPYRLIAVLAYSEQAASEGQVGLRSGEIQACNPVSRVRHHWRTLVLMHTK